MRRFTWAASIAVSALLVLAGLTGAVADDSDGGGDPVGTKYLKCLPTLEVSLVGDDTVKAVVGARGLFGTGTQAAVPDAAEPSASPTSSSSAEPTTEPSASATPAPTTANPSPSPTAEPSVQASVASSASAAADQRDAPAKLTAWCWSFKVHIRAVNEASGAVLFNDTFTRDFWVLDTKETVEFKAGPGVKVKVTATHGGDTATESITMPDVPRIVDNLVVSAVSHDAATLQWKPGDDGGRPILDYSVDCAGAFSVKGLVTTSVTIPGLRPTTSYGCKVGARNRIGPGPLEDVWFTTTAAPRRPSEPRSLRVFRIPTLHVLGADWLPPLDDGGRPVTSYRALLQWTDRAVGEAHSEDMVVAGSSVIWTVPSLPATRYTIQVWANNAVGPSAPLAGTFTTPLDPVPRPELAPGVPRGLAIPEVTQTQMRVTWRPPADDGGSAITGYLVSWTAKGATKRALITPDLTAVVDGLEPGSEYTVIVQAMNKKGVSAEESVSGRTAKAPEPEPVKPDPPKDPAIFWQSTTAIGLTWQAPLSDGGSPITRYEVTDEAGNVARTMVRFAFMGGYQAGTEHTFEVRAINDKGASLPATVSGYTAMDPVPIPEAPTSPNALTVVSTTTSSIALTWQAPDSDGGNPITGYTVSWGGPDSLVVEARSAVIEGLRAGTSYPIAVAAMNDMGSSAPATKDVATSTSPVPGPGKPSVPQRVHVTGVTGVSIALDWAAPASDGGAPITGYSVRVEGGVPFVVPGTAAAVSGLQPNRVYSVEVRALNAVDQSDPATVSARTGTDTPGPAPAPAPFGPVAPGGNVDGSLDLDGRTATARQTSTGKWPRATTVRSGAVVLIERQAGFVTNAGQVARLRVSYRSPSIASVPIRFDAKTKTYTMRPLLRPGMSSGSVILTVHAPAITVGSKKYEQMTSSQRFIVKRIVGGRG
jgi:hypothetical protein